LRLQFPGISTTVLFEDEVVEFIDSETVTWEVESSTQVKANLAFPAEAAHQHFYGLTPETTNYTDFQTTSVYTTFIEDTLRVYINGIRIYTDDDVYVPDSSVTTWALINIAASDYEAGTFSLSRAITSDDIIKIDFDTDFS
jgi:hypothetical protein